MNQQLASVWAAISPLPPSRFVLGFSRLATVACRGELGADVAGLPRTQFDIQSEGLLPVADGPSGVFRGLVTVAEALMSASVLVFIGLWTGQLEGGSVLRTGLTGLAGGEEKLTETVERLGLPGCVTGLAKERPGVAEMLLGVPVATPSQFSDAKVT